MNESAMARERMLAYAELMFVIAPMLVYALTYAFAYKSLIEVLRLPEWSMANMLLFGQTTIRIVRYFIEAQVSGIRVKQGAPVLILAAVICLGLIPSTIILALHLWAVAGTAGASAPDVGFIPIMLFGVATALYVFSTTLVYDSTDPIEEQTSTSSSNVVRVLQPRPHISDSGVDIG